MSGLNTEGMTILLNLLVTVLALSAAGVLVWLATLRFLLGSLLPALRGGLAMQRWLKTLSYEQRCAFAAWWNNLDLEESHERLSCFTPKLGHTWLHFYALPRPA